jgi:adenylate cyclase
VQGVELRERGRWTFRNVTEPVQVYAAVRQGARSSAGLPVDPVCRMAVDPWHSAGRLTHEGVEYCFCSLGCAGVFAQDPHSYTMTDHHPPPIIRPATARDRHGHGCARKQEE